MTLAEVTAKAQALKLARDYLDDALRGTESALRRGGAYQIGGEWLLAARDQLVEALHSVESSLRWRP